MEVFAPLGQLAGTVEQNWSILTPSFSVKNAAGDTILLIEGPFCTFRICGDVEFKVYILLENILILLLKILLCEKSISFIFQSFIF